MPELGPLGPCSGLQPVTALSTLGSPSGPLLGSTASPSDVMSAARCANSSATEDPAWHSQALPQVVATAPQHSQNPLLHSCLAVLLAADWPAGQGSRASVQPCSRVAGYYNFGVQASCTSRLTAVTNRLPHVCQKLNELLGQLFPREVWNCICVSHNCVSAARRDLANEAGSPNLAVGLGEYQGGELWIQGSAPAHARATLLDLPLPGLPGLQRGHAFPTKHCMLRFSGLLWHKTMPFSGDRWLITAYTLPSVEAAALAGLGFPPSSEPGAAQEFAGSAQGVFPGLQHPSKLPAAGSRPCPGHSEPRASKKSPLPLGAVNWSGCQSASGFASHTLRVQQPPCLPDEVPSASSLLLNLRPGFFLDICCGVSAPLSSCVQSLGCDVLCIDVLRDSSMDILHAPFYEQLLFLCGSGAVGYAAASPSCNEYSLLKLSGGPPYALRTPAHLQGLPDLSPSDLAKVQASHTMLQRACCAISAVHLAGGHAHLEQPRGAMSWQEPCVRAWLVQSSAALCVLPACHFGRDWAKTWLMASSYRGLSSIASQCTHPRGSHQAQRGWADGHWRSRQTAEYPPELCQAFASAIRHLVGGTSTELSLAHARSLVPQKSLAQHPTAIHDGGGRNSVPDWSMPHSKDFLRPLRTVLLEFCVHHKAPQRLLARGSIPSSEALFTAAEVAEARALVFPALGLRETDDAWAVREDQPFCLNALHRIANLCEDADIHLFPALKQGVCTGFLNDIPPSHSFWQNSNDPLGDIPLSLHFQNWRSAHVDEATTAALLQEELDAGFCYRYSGTVEAAKTEWPTGLALGKLAVVRAPGRKERLVLDNSVCGTNANCFVPERQLMPSVRDVMASFPLRGEACHQAAMSLDIKSAHKRIVVKPSERGLLGFTWGDSLFFYKVAPFGATFSQHYWGRMGACLLRLLHILIWVSHSAHLFVDDYLFSQQCDLLPHFGSMVCLFLQVMGVPLSWKKLQISFQVDWIGWHFCFSSGVVSLSEEKRDRLLGMVQSLLRAPRTTRKDLERFIGLAMWACNLFPVMRSMLHSFYHDLHSPAATNYSIDPSTWPSISRYLDASLHFTASPPNTAIPVGGKLLAARHQNLSCLSDLVQVRLTDRRLWLRVSNKASSKRKLSAPSLRALSVVEHWLTFCLPQRSMRAPLQLPFEARADASAKGSRTVLGGYVCHPRLGQLWFSEAFTLQDFRDLGVSVSPDMASEISCYEALAQGGLIIAASSLLPACSVPILLPAASDNTGAESALNACFTTSLPLALFLERLTLLAAVHRCTLDVSHISGERNTKADALSRPTEYPLPQDCLPSQRLRLDLRALWLPRPHIAVFPSDASLPWPLPQVAPNAGQVHSSG